MKKQKEKHKIIKRTGIRRLRQKGHDTWVTTETSKKISIEKKLGPKDT